MGKGKAKPDRGVGPTLWSLLLIACLLLLVAHLWEVVGAQDSAESGLMDRTFTSVDGPG